MSDSTNAPGWYPDPYGRHEHRWFDGAQWTDQVASHGKQSVDPPTAAHVPTAVHRDPARTQRDVAKATVGGQASWQGSGHLLDEPVLVVSQKAKLIEVNNEYGVFDAAGSRLGMVRQVGQSKAKKVLRVISNVDQYLTHKLQVCDPSGNVVLALTRPAKVMKSRVIVEDGQGRSLGEIQQENMIGKIHFGIMVGGQRIGSINGENWRAWNFRIDDAGGTEVARITKTFEGVARTLFTTADNYVVQIHQRLAEPLRSMVVASALCVDTALKQDSRAGLMAPFHHPPINEIRRVVAAALAEDLNPLGDLSAGLLDAGTSARAAFVPRRDGVLAGTRSATEAFIQLDAGVDVEWTASDGDAVRAGEPAGTVRGPLASILTAERTALNFLNHLSGVATLTRQYVEAARSRGGTARVWDTRKTTPGLRSLEKAAVRAGGGWNHRGNLSDWVMFKDNHLTGIGIAEAVRRARDSWPARTVHVECDTLDKVGEALSAGADAILLDNMDLETVRAAVAMVAESTPRPLLEASGGITIATIADYAATGVDVVSTGQITISAPVLDIGLDINPEEG